MFEGINLSPSVDSPKISFVFPAVIIAIIALPLFRLFSPQYFVAAFISWLIIAAVIIAIMLIIKQSILHSLLGIAMGITITFALIGLAGLGRMDISPSEIRGIFSVKRDISLPTEAAFEAKESLFHSEIDQGARWSYRAFYVKVQDNSGLRYFYVFQQSADGSIPTQISLVPGWLWLFPV